MRRDLLGIGLALAMVMSFSAASSAQTKQAVAAPKSADSNPAHDLSGVWFDDHPRLIRVQERYFWAYTYTPEAPP